jgi:hypothetical protein
MVADWGYNGTWYDADMARIDALTLKETAQYRFGATAGGSSSNTNNRFAWQRSTSVHPHMVRAVRSY